MGSWVGADDWDSGEGPAPLPSARRLALIVCCPSCESADVFKRDHRAGELVTTWQCRVCGARWKEPASLGDDGRATLA